MFKVARTGEHLEISVVSSVTICVLLKFFFYHLPTTTPQAVTALEFTHGARTSTPASSAEPSNTLLQVLHL